MSNESDSTIAVARPAVVTEDVFCQQCAYNLRGLRLGGVCPECGLDLRLAMGGNALGDCNPEWLGKLRRGVGLILTSVLLSVILEVSDDFLSGATINKIPYGSLELIATVIQVYGVYLLTAPEPNRVHQENSVTLRNIVRFSAIAVLLGSVLELAPTGLPNFLRIIGALMGFLALVVYFGQLIYLRRFARRIPDFALENSTNIVLWGISIAGVIGILGLILMALSTHDVAGGITLCGAMLVYVVFGIWYLILLSRYRTVFSEAERQSRSKITDSLDSKYHATGERFT